VSEAAAASDAAAAGSPLSPRALRDLWFAPRRFFSRGWQLTEAPEVTFVAYVIGVAGMLARLTTLLSRSPGELVHNLTANWTGTWLFVLCGAVINAAIRWYALGWWYAKRVQWSGGKDADLPLARSVWAYQNLVYALPHVLVMIAATFVFESYAAFVNGRSFVFGLIVQLSLFWSCLTAYVGATTAFPDVSRARAAIWFIVLPLVFYTMVLLFAIAP
jgi:hypothetical protein